MTRRKPDVIVGGGIAGIAAAVRLAEAGREVVLVEKRAFLGGRATSFVDKDTGEEIDNCQHVVLGCCTNVLDLFGKLGVADRIRFTDDFHYVEPDGRVHHFAPAALPAPLHFLPALLRFAALGPGERLAVVRAFLAMMLSSRRALLAAGETTIGRWLERRAQPARTVRRFWEPILVSAVNEHLDRASALPCLQVFLQGFLPHRRAAAMGVPTVGLAQLYGEPARRLLEERGSRVLTRARVDGVVVEGGRARAVRLAGGDELALESLVLALPPESLVKVTTTDGEPLVAAGRGLVFEHSPITGIHLWFDRRVFDLPHAVLLDATIQWVFAKEVDAEAAERLGARQRLQLVVSASHDLTHRSQADLIELALADLARPFPAVRKARLVKGVVVKESRATISSTPEAERRRPAHETRLANAFLAGDWTRTAWPATLEGATRSGRVAAAAALGRPAELTPDLPRSLLARLLLARVPRDWPRPDLNGA